MNELVEERPLNEPVIISAITDGVSPKYGNEDRGLPNKYVPHEKILAVHSHALTGLFIIATLFVLYCGRTLLVPAVLAILLSFVFAPVVRILKNRGIIESIGAGFIVGALILAVCYSVYSLAAPAASWLEDAPSNLRRLEAKLQFLKEPMAKMKDAGVKVEQIAAGGTPPTSERISVRKEETGVGTVLSASSEILEQMVILIVLLYFLLASGDMFLRKIVNVLPRTDDKIKAIDVARNIESEISHYLLTVTLINAALGLCVGVAMRVIGMPNPALWGFMVGILAFIPYVGATVSLAILTSVSFLTFDSPSYALWVPGVFLLIDVAVEQILNPIIIGKRLELNSVMVFAGLAFWGWLWGPIGALAAVPILVVVKIFCDHIERYSLVGEFLGAEERRAK